MSHLRHAAAVALSVVLLGGCAGDDGGAETARATPSPTASTSTAPPLPATWVDTLPVGAPPRIGYVVGHAYHSPDGRLVHLPRDRGTTWLTRFRDGYFVVDDRFFEGTAGVALLDAEGNRVRELGGITGSPALSADGATLRWVSITADGVSRSEWEPPQLHVADVATGEIRSRVVPRRDVRSSALVGRTPHVRIPQRVLPGRWLRRTVLAKAVEDRHHRLVAVRRGREAAILRVDLRRGAWELAVDWTPLEGTYVVAFETRR